MKLKRASEHLRAIITYRLMTLAVWIAPDDGLKLDLLKCLRLVMLNEFKRNRTNEKAASEY